MKTKIIKIVLPLLLFAIFSMNIFANPARVISKQENIPDGRRDLKTIIFLDITPNDGNDRADAYVDITRINSFMSLQEFTDMIQTGDIFEYILAQGKLTDGRYTVLPETNLIDYNGKNIYEIFLKELEDKIAGTFFYYAEKAYKDKQR